MSSTRQPALASRFVPLVFAYLAERGVDASDVIARFGLPPDIARNDIVTLSGDVIRSIGELVEQRTGDPFFAFPVTQQLERGTYGVIEFAARNAPDLRGAIERLVRYQRLINDVVVFSTEARPRGALAVENRFLGQPNGLGRPANEYTIAVPLLLLREVLGRQELAPVRVWFMHPRPPDTSGIERWFGTTALAFGCDSNGLLFEADLLDEPFPSADGLLLPILDDHARLLLPYTAPAVDLLARIRAQLRQGLSGDPSLAKTAAALRMSARTLQRRLSDLGTTFNGVLDGVRAELAREYMLDARIAIGEVAYLLGFSDARAFLRAFKRWTGEPPQQYRRRVLLGRLPPERRLVEHLSAIALDMSAHGS